MPLASLRVRRKVWSLVSCLMFASCGSLMSADRFEVPVTSAPAGAEVFRDGVVVGATPCVVVVTRDEPGFELRRQGHRPCRVECGTVVNPWFLANVSTGFLGGVVDFALGSDRNPDSAPIHVFLAEGGLEVTTVWVRSPAARRSGGVGGGSLSGLGRLVGGFVRLHQDPSY